MRGDRLGEARGEAWRLMPAAVKAFQHLLRGAQCAPEGPVCPLPLVPRVDIEQHEPVVAVWLDAQLQLVAPVRVVGFQPSAPDPHARRRLDEGRRAVDRRQGDQEVDEGVQHMVLLVLGCARSGFLGVG